MKYLLCVLCGCVSLLRSPAQIPADSLAIIPAPVSMTTGTGRFALPEEVYVELPPNKAAAAMSALTGKLTRAAGVKVSAVTGKAKASIRMILYPTADTAIGQEGYRLSVSSGQIVLQANTEAGLFYGVQTLLQLFPSDIESSTKVTGRKWDIPAVEITDYPRFSWRGLMFDVARHFFTVDDVKRYIDAMVRYKFNLLHLHLSDDEGWRVEIKGYPRLTEVGAWNVKKVGYFGTFSKPGANEKRDYGGFYTQDDIRELVKYARDHYVNILPEIDVPGHSLAAIASYPELSCTPGADRYVVRSGEPIMDWSHGAPPIALVDNTLCPANELVYKFLDTVVAQLAQLFPFEYIHLGGDECPKNFWQKNDAIKALMKTEGLKTMEEVQSYFEKRVEKIVESKGKKFMGWDEILEGGLAPNAAVMSWRNMRAGAEAAKMGHDVVMSPVSFAYLDYMQGDPVVEAKVYASLRLSKAYEFDPVPKGTDAKYIKGGQANLWSEQLYNMRTVEYMMWPRGWAIAESVWSPVSKKSWKDFYPRVVKHFDRFDAAGIKYSPAVYDPIFTISKSDSSLKVDLRTEATDVDIYYSFDNSYPDRFYPKYSGTLNVPKDASMLRVITYKGDAPVGRMITMPITDMKKRADQKSNFP